MKTIDTNNIKSLVKEMQKDAEEYDLHNEGCGTEREDECDCENMAVIKKFTEEWMIKVNDKWFTLTEAHRPYCTSEGNKVITRILGKKNRKYHQCCDGECNHDDCCGKVKENCRYKCKCHE